MGDDPGLLFSFILHKLEHDSQRSTYFAFVTICRLWLRQSWQVCKTVKVDCSSKQAREAKVDVSVFGELFKYGFPKHNLILGQ